MKKLLSIILLVALWGCAMAYDFSAVCSSGQTLYYNITSNEEPYTVEVASENTSNPYYTTYPTGDLQIPETVVYNSITYSVTSIGNSVFSNCYGLTSVTIPSSVTNIGNFAFYGCSGLTGTLTIPEAVTNIGSRAFMDCDGLTTVNFNATNCTTMGSGSDASFGFSSFTTLNIGENVTNIPAYAFYACEGITEVTIHESITSIGRSAFTVCSSLTTVNFNATNCTSIGEGSMYPAFFNCQSFTTLNIGDNVTNIPASAFYECNGLTSVTIPNSVTSIGNYAFNYVKNIVYNGTATGSPWGALTFNGYVEGNFVYEDDTKVNLTGCSTLVSSVDIPTSVISIGDNAFRHCDNLTSVTIPNSVETIGNQAFYYCSRLAEVSITNSVTSIGNNVFMHCDLTEPVYNENCFAYFPDGYATEYAIPEGIQQISGSAFYGCSGLTGVTVPSSVTSIGNNAFYATGLTTVNYNAMNCTSASIFANVSSLETLNIGESVKNIPDNAFRACTGLTEITIPDSITNIGNNAFTGCTGLTTVNFNAKNCTYMGNSNTSGRVFSECTSLTTLNIGENVESIPNYAFYSCKSLASLTIPESVTAIGNGAFSYCEGLTGELVIPNSVITIGSENDTFGAFWHCNNITSVTIGNSVETIGKCAFQDCSSLTSITIPESVTSIYDKSFESCTSLTTVNFNAENCTTMGSSSNPAFADCSLFSILNIGERVKNIPSYAFYNCSGLTDTLTIPDSVTNIGERAFYGCSGLTTVNFNAENCTTMGSESNYVFYNCTSLATLNIGEKVKNIPDYAFKNCSGPTGTLIIPDSVTNIGAQAFYNCSGYEALTMGKSVETIGTEAFYGCNFSTLNYNSANCSSTLFTSNSTITTITIGEDVETVPNNAFENCSALATVNYNATNCTSEDFGFYQCTAFTTLNIGDNVTNIPRWAFYNSIRLNTVTIPSTVESIGENAFYRVRNIIYNGSATGSPWGALTVNGFTDGYLVYSDDTKTNLTGCIASATSVTIPSTVTTIGENAFYNCSGLTEITIPSTVTSIGYNAFNGTGWYNSQPDGILYLGDWCLGYKNDWPTGSFAIQDGIKNICDKAFYACGELTELTIPNSVTSIGVNAFSRCTELTTVNFNAENCTTMGNYSYNVFGDGTTLTTLNIGERVKTIPDNAFYNCNGLSEITIPDSVTNIGTYAFSRCSSIDTVNIGKGVESIGERAFYSCTGLTTVNFNAENCTYMGSESQSTFGDCTTLATLNIGERVKIIPDFAFYDCSGLTGTLTIPDSVTNIGTYAFGSCSSIDTVNIGKGVESIGERAFYNCTELTAVNFNAKNCTTMGSLVSPAFNSCSSFSTLNIGEDVKNIPAYAFRNCYALTEVTISDSVTNIGEQAFIGCNGLTSVYYTGNIDKWCGITFSEPNANPLDYAHNLYIDNILLTDLSIPETVTELKEYAFIGATCLTSVTIPNSVTSIGNSAFQSCREVTEITIGNSVENIGDGAFKFSESITNINIKANAPPALGENIFTETTYNSATLWTPCTLDETYRNDSQWGQFTNIQNDTAANLVVEVQTADADMGSVTGDGTFSCETEAIITATPNQGYRFLSWNDGNEDNPRTIVVTKDSTFTAGFKATYIITATAGEGGTITPNGETTVDEGESQSFTITPNECYAIASVLVDGEDVTADLVDGVYTIANVTTGHTISASFEHITYTITVTAGNGGMITPTGNVDVACGENIDFTITPNDGYRISSVLVDGIDAINDVVDGVYTFENVIADHTIAATFELITYTIVATAGNGGTITPDGDVAVEAGSSMAFAIVPNEAYRIATVIVDGENNVTAELVENVYTFENVTADHTIEATFEEIPVEASFTTNPEASGDTLSIVLEQMVEYTNTSLNAHHIHWYFEGADTVESEQNYIPAVGYRELGIFHTTLVAYNEDETLTDTATLTVVVTTLSSYTITAVSANEEYGTVTGGGTYEEGDTATLTAIPNEGYLFVSWDDGNTDNPRTITVTSDSTFVATFAEDVPTYTITVVSANEEYGTVTGSGTYAEGDEAIITAIPNEGYMFVSWNGDNTDNPRTITVTSDSTFVAIFDVARPPQYTITVLANNAAYGYVSGGGTYYEGDTIMLTAIPYDGFSFVSWDDGNYDNPRSVVVTSDSTFVADFAKCEITQTVDTVVQNFVTVGDHTFYSTGNYSFEVRHENGCDTIFDIRLRVLAEPVYDIGPNPTKSLLYINSDGFISAVEFYSVAGQLVMRKEVNGYEAEFDVESFVEGVYVLRIYGAESSLPAVFKIVKE